jgi:hypothetical protein
MISLCNICGITTIILGIIVGGLGLMVVLYFILRAYETSAIRKNWRLKMDIDQIKSRCCGVEVYRDYDMLDLVFRCSRCKKIVEDTIITAKKKNGK